MQAEALSFLSWVQLSKAIKQKQNCYVEKPVLSSDKHMDTYTLRTCGADHFFSVIHSLASVWFSLHGLFFLLISQTLLNNKIIPDLYPIFYLNEPVNIAFPNSQQPRDLVQIH